MNFKRFSPVLLGSVLGFAAFVGFYLSDSEPSRHESDDLSVDQVELFAEVLWRIRDEYVDSVDEADLVENAIRSILADLDEHSRFLDEEAYESTLISASSHYSGVGLDVTVDDGKVTVVAPLAGAPAERAGILPHDVVVSVDDIPIDPENTQDAISRMRGEPGTTVTLDVMRNGVEDPLRFALTRAEVRLTTVHTDYLGDGFGYMRLSSFTDGTGEELHQAVEELLSEHDLQAVVLDMRDNPGGTLGAAVDVADAFLEEGLIVRGSGRIDEARFEENATPGDVIDGRKLIVLVDGRSASASEIVAAALQENGRARVVGERTYGKGSVQTVIPLLDGGALKLTTSEYFTPNGRSIDGTGVEPDLVVPGGRRYRGPGSRIAPDDDIQLTAALHAAGYNLPGSP
ncbi:MAG: S41 family peptidase [Rhodospirillaceae bacterium]|nr:S41 family peptidase [Rhodospirillaceae bacterium]MDE0361772.1 S41 family peptidase [Rhodospirillaceae bacterium]